MDPQKIFVDADGTKSLVGTLNVSFFVRSKKEPTGSTSFYPSFTYKPSSCSMVICFGVYFETHSGNILRGSKDGHYLAPTCLNDEGIQFEKELLSWFGHN